MAGFIGADVDQLRLLSRELAQQSEALDALVSRVGQRVEQVAWRGPDAERFRSEWNTRLSADVRRAARVLDDASARTAEDARQQEDVSSGGVGSGSGRVPESLPGGLPDLVPHDWIPGQILPVEPRPFELWPGQEKPAFVDTLPDRFDSEDIWSGAREFVATEVPGTNLSFSEIGTFVPGVSTALDVQTIADSFAHGEVPVHAMVDVGAGALRESGNPIGYGTGVAVGVWNNVFEEAEKADFRPETVTNTLNYAQANPGDALNAAGEALVDWVPSLVKNFKFW